MLERQTTKAMVESGVYEPAYTSPGGGLSSAYPSPGGGLSTTKNNLLSHQPVVSKETTKTNLTVTNTGSTLGKCKKVYL